MTARNKIAGPGALIPSAGGEFTTAVSRCPVVGLTVGLWVAPRPSMTVPASVSVRIFAVSRGGSRVRPTPARAESRDATARSRAGSRSRAAKWRPAQADGGQSDGARPSLRAGAASPRRSTGTRRSSAARRVSVTVDSSNHGVIGRPPARLRPLEQREGFRDQGSAGHGDRAVLQTALADQPGNAKADRKGMPPRQAKDSVARVFGRDCAVRKLTSCTSAASELLPNFFRTQAMKRKFDRRVIARQ